MAVFNNIFNDTSVLQLLIHFLHTKPFRRTKCYVLHCLYCFSLLKWNTHCRICKATNDDINKIAIDFSLWADALHSSSSQTPQNSRVNFSSISWKLFKLHVVLESFSKATQLLTVTLSPSESGHKRKIY